MKGNTMPTFKIQQCAEVWYEITVVADTLQEALDQGVDDILAGNAHEVFDSTTFTDNFWAENTSTGESGFIVYDDENEPIIVD